LRAGGGVDGIWGSEGFEGSELIKGADDQFWFGQNRDRVRLEAGSGSIAGFELALEDEGGEGESVGRQAELGAKEDLSRPASGQRHDETSVKNRGKNEAVFCGVVVETRVVPHLR